MPNTADGKRLAARIRAISPGLEIDTFEINRDGLANEVVVVNGEYVYRFAREAEWARAAMRSELGILEQVRPRLPVAVPEPFYEAEGAVAYRYLPGEPLTLDLLTALPQPARAELAAQLGACLRALHETPLLDSTPATTAPVTASAWARIRAEVEAKVYPLMLGHQREWAARLFDEMLADPGNFDYPPRLIHGDLGPYHILYDRASNRITGLIDFGVAGGGDPANDVGLFLQVYGGKFVELILKDYAEARSWLRRARFYAQAIELQWALNGLRSGDAQWFVAHLGGARDLL